jgi:ABC-type branched-subunit amino acid transport system substrate-binding protein
MKEQRFAPKVLATNNLIEDLKIKKAPQELFEGVFITDWQPSEIFLTKFKQRFGRDAVVEAHNSYEALRSLAQALKANETDPVSSLRTVKYEGVAGTIDFSGSSFANHSVGKLYQVKNGNLELVL